MKRPRDHSSKIPRLANMSGEFAKKMISKRTTSTVRHHATTKGSEKRPVEECCVCFEDPGDPESLCCHWATFPCTHKTCDKCFARLDECPLCRAGKDGTPGTERQAARQRTEVDDYGVRAMSLWLTFLSSQPLDAGLTVIIGTTPELGAMPELQVLSNFSSTDRLEGE